MKRPPVRSRAACISRARGLLGPTPAPHVLHEGHAARRRRAFAPSLPIACRVLFGSRLSVGFRFAAALAFRMFLRAATRCFAVAMDHLPCVSRTPPCAARTPSCGSRTPRSHSVRSCARAPAARESAASVTPRSRHAPTGYHAAVTAEFLYLTTTGRVSGAPREIEIWFTEDAGRYYVIAEHGDRAHWVQNLRANPRVRVRVGDRSFAARARVV